MAVMGHTWGFTSGTASGVLVLFYLTLVRTLTCMLVYHDVCQDRVERHNREMTPVYGASDK